MNPLDEDAEEVPSVRAGSMTLVDGRSFVMSDVVGDIDGGISGLVHADNRFLSRLVVRVEGHSLESLSAGTWNPFHAVWASRFRRDLTTAASSASSGLMIRRRFLEVGLREEFEIRNLSPQPASFTVRVLVAADFAHIFEVKAGVARARRPFSVDGAALVASSADGDLAVRVTPTPAPKQILIESGEMIWHLDLPARSGETIHVTVEPLIGHETRGAPSSDRAALFEAIPLRRLASWEATVPRLISDDSRLARVVEQSLEDIAALRIFDDEHPERVVVAAGAPWFMTLFGRDSLITAYMCLPFAPELAVGVLHSLADLQGRVDDPESEEQPGKILHELRRRGGGGPFSRSSRYYGTIDATPLFVMLAAEAWRWGALAPADLPSLMPAIDAAMGWIATDGDIDGDGFVEYHRRSPRGLANQGWKDSWDGITFADGTMPVGPIALAEVQGYCYAAHIGAAELWGALGRDDDAQHARSRALELRKRFNAMFWNADRGWFVLGLDGAKRQIDALATNAGHALWAGIADPELADQYLGHLGGSAMFTGWGLRTLSSEMGAYDPLSYHNGSVWPHDSALCAAGAARYGDSKLAQRIAGGLLDAATRCSTRLPELFAGLSNIDVPSPVAYPSSCSPQAWASASVLLLIRALTGFDADVPNGRIYLTDRTTELPNFRLTRLHVGGDRLDLSASDGVVHVDAAPSSLEVVRRSRR
jgi:glycogen debranching enzyme